MENDKNVLDLSKHTIEELMVDFPENYRFGMAYGKWYIVSVEVYRDVTFTDMVMRGNENESIRDFLCRYFQKAQKEDKVKKMETNINNLK